MNAHDRIGEIKLKFSKENIEDINLVLRWYELGRDLAELKHRSNNWAVRVACTLIPKSNWLANAEWMLEEWKFNADLSAALFDGGTNCELCNHQHCTILFPITNKSTKSTVYVGSRCILYFCETANVVGSDTYDLLLVDKWLKEAEAIIREQMRRESILKAIEHLEGPFWDSMRDIHSTDKKIKKKVSITPSQAKVIVPVGNCNSVSITIGTKKHSEAARASFSVIKPALRADQIDRLIKKYPELA